MHDVTSAEEASTTPG